MYLKTDYVFMNLKQNNCSKSLTPLIKRGFFRTQFLVALHIFQKLYLILVKFACSEIWENP